MQSSSGVVVAVENMPALRLLRFRLNPYWFNRPRQLARFPHLTFDTAHLGSWGLNPVEVYEQLRERIAHVHLSNFDGRDHRSPPDGHLPLGEFLQHLSQDGYGGTISVESSPDALDAEDEEKCRAALKRALVFCRDHFVKKRQ
jgi:sugar phosphate isomerase/epimerase